MPHWRFKQCLILPFIGPVYYGRPRHRASVLWEGGSANKQITKSSSLGCWAPSFSRNGILNGASFVSSLEKDTFGENTARYRECNALTWMWLCTWASIVNLNEMNSRVFWFCFRYDDIRSFHIVTWSNKTPLGVCTMELGGRDVVGFLNIAYEGDSNSCLCNNHYLEYIVSYAADNKSYVRDDALPWRHNGRDGVWNHRRLHCLLYYWFRHTSKNTPKLRVTGLCEADFPHKRPVTRKIFPFDDVIMKSYAGGTHTWLIIIICRSPT